VRDVGGSNESFGMLFDIVCSIELKPAACKGEGCGGHI
jgi:hypothetical protein